MGNVLYHVGDLVDSLHDKLTVQIGRALRHDAGASSMCSDDHDFEALGQAKAIQFLEQIPALREVLRLDVRGRLRRRPGRQEHRRDHVLLSRPGGGDDLSSRPPAAQARDPASSRG